MTKIELSPRIRRDQKKIAPEQWRKIASAILELAYDPRPGNSKPLTNMKDVFRLRVGDYRVIYHYNAKAQTIRIDVVRHRSDVYDALKRL
jgi:mRNA interferase RelE/StbE